MKGLVESKHPQLCNTEIVEEPSSTDKEFFIFSGLAAFFYIQNQKSVNVATNMSFCFTVRIPVHVKWSSADQAVVKSGTDLPSQNSVLILLTFSHL